MESINKTTKEDNKIKEKLDYIKNLPIQKYNGNYIDMQELKYESDFVDLFNLINNDKDFSNLVRRRFITGQSFEDFKIQIKNWFKEDTNFVFIIKDKEQKPIGVNILYSLNPIKNEIKLSIFLKEESRNSKKTIESYTSVLKFILQVLKVDTIKYSVYTDNDYILNMYKKILKDIEGVENTNGDFKTFSLDKKIISSLIDRLESILNRKSV